MERAELETIVKAEAENAAKAAVASMIEGKKKQAKKRLRRRIRKAVIRAGVAAGLVCTGYMIGVHRNVIRAYLTGGPMPELPDGHPQVCPMTKNNAQSH